MNEPSKPEPAPPAEPKTIITTFSDGSTLSDGAGIAQPATGDEQ